MTTHYLTTGKIAELFGVKTWQAMRAVDTVFPNAPRAGLYRLILRSQLGQVAIELQRRGWLPKEEVAHA